MKRRDFLKVAVGSCLLGGIYPEAFAQAQSVVALAEGQDYGAITRNVVSALGGMQRFVKPGNTVVVKPNIGWDRKPEYAANTHPLVVKAIVEKGSRSLISPAMTPGGATKTAASKQS